MASKTLSIILEAQDRASKTLKGFSKQLDKAGISQEKLARSAKIAGAAITAFGVALGTMAVKSAVAFEKSMANIDTLFDDTGESAEALGNGIKKMLNEIPKSAEDLGASAYAVVSAGITDTSEALKILEASAKLAVAGLGSTEEATTLMVLAQNNFKNSTLSANEKANVLFKTVRNGITTVADMSRSFGLLAPLFETVGGSLEEMSAATAALTQVNKSASISQNSLKAGLVAMSKPTAEAQKLLEKLGVETFAALVEKTGGVIAAWGAMQEATEGNTQMFAKAMGSGEALTSVISLLGSQAESFASSMESMADGVNVLDEAFQKQLETTTAQWQLLKNKLNVVLMELGNEILPMILPKIKELGEFIKKLNPAWVKFALVASLIIGPLLILAGFIGPLVTGFGILAGVMGVVFSAMGLIVIAIVGIVAAIVILITKWDWFKKRFTEVFPRFAKFLSKFKFNFKEAFDNSILKNFGILLWDTLNIIVAFVADSIRNFLNFFKNIGKGFSALGKALRGDFDGAKQDIKNLLEDVTLNSREAFNTMLEHSSDFASGVANNMAIANQSISNSMSLMTSNVMSNMNAVGQSIAGGIDLITYDLLELPKAGEQSGDGVGDGLSGGIGSGVDEAKKRLEELGEAIADLLEKETQLRAGNNRNNLSLAFSTAEAFVNQEEKVAELRKQLASETDNIKKGILKEELRKEEEALDKRKLIEEEFSSEISEVKRRAALTDFDRTIEDILKKRIKLDKEYQDKLRDITNELKDNEDKRDQLIAISDTISDALITNSNNVASNEIANNKAVIQSINEANAARASSVMSVAPMMSYASNMNSVNDAVISPKGEVITTHPDDYIIATKNPQSLGGKGNITVNINGGTYLSEEVAEEIGDMIISKLQTNIRV